MVNLSSWKRKIKRSLLVLLGHAFEGSVYSVYREFKDSMALISLSNCQYTCTSVPHEQVCIVVLGH